MIDHYCILNKLSDHDGYVFVTGYKSLSTLRKRFNHLKEMIGSEKHSEIILCARDYNKVIVKVYDRY